MQNVWAFWEAVCSIMGNGCNPGGFILQAWEVAVFPWWVSKGVGRRMQRIHANEALWSSSLIRLEQASLSLREAVSWAMGKVPNQSLPALWLWGHSRHPGGRSLKKTLAGDGKVMEFRTRPPPPRKGEGHRCSTETHLLTLTWPLLTFSSFIQQTVLACLLCAKHVAKIRSLTWKNSVLVGVIPIQIIEAQNKNCDA